MFRDALNAPARTADAVQTLFLGGFLSLLALLVPIGWLATVGTVPFFVLALPFVLLPPLLLRGYYVRVMQAGLRGEEAAPSFVRWNRLVADGLRSYAVAFVYLLPVVTLWVLVAVVAIAVELRTLGGPTSSVFVTLSTALAAVVSGLYLPVFAYLVPAALVTYAATGRLAAAFSPRTVGRVLVDGEYAKGWAVASLLLFGALTVAVPLSLFLVGVFVLFYLQTVVHSLYGRTARKALAVELGDDDRARAERGQRRPEVEAAVQVGRSVGLAEGRGEAVSPTDGDFSSGSECGDDRVGGTRRDDDRPRDDRPRDGTRGRTFEGGDR
ncbi:DUF4013 domain-containing protein [Haloprofundus salilacus]|uniref:DUF4013 domain-containing protein n=1 Tax=Haloprofundus salilacus TaxID=2876190 RepID=UPI001CCE0799|nr:DUF4013 domain-containing protein [Haloprofundus salilacus]